MRSAEPLAEPLAGLRRRWVAAFVLAELIGFIPPAITGATLAALGVPELVLIIGLTLAGCLEGAAIGIAQAHVLARYHPELDGAAWVRATLAAAGFAWFTGMGGAALMSAQPLPAVLLAALMVPAWLAALLAMGWAQWRVLRRMIPRSAQWVWISAGAWLLGVSVPVVALSAAPNRWAPAAHVIIGIAAAVTMGLIVGVLTGGTLRRLLSPGPQANRSNDQAVDPHTRAASQDQSEGQQRHLPAQPPAP